MRVKLCFKCQEYVPILENNYLNSKEVIAFEKFHSGHPVQIVNKEEVANARKWAGSTTQTE